LREIIDKAHREAVKRFGDVRSVTAGADRRSDATGRTTFGQTAAR
jgi:hypothetical protein